MSLKSVVAILLTAPFLLTACNTVEGAGQDISNAGQAISEAAN